MQFHFLSKEMLYNIFWTFITIIIALVVFITMHKLIKRVLIKKAKTKKQISNVLLFMKIVKYLFAFILILVIISSYFGSWTEFGLVTGLFTAALGFALHKPIAGIVAWIILIIRRPFDIGDRIIIGGIKGDVKDITITHIYLEEIGGTIDGEEKSGRIVVIPNSILFEKEIINYTAQHDFILDEVVVAITYESNLKKAEKIVKETVEGIMKEYWKNIPKRIEKGANIRLLFKDSGIDVIARYYTIAKKRNEIATNIVRGIYNKIRRATDVEIAYPHAEILFRKK